MKLRFTKMQSLGNDFIILNMTKKKIPLSQKLIRKLCDRRFGIGADQILTLAKTRKADFKTNIYNKDGGEVQICGNGLRCLASLIRDTNLSRKKTLTIETKSGIRPVTFISKNKIKVDMGSPILKGKQIPVNLNGRIINRPLKIERRDFRITCVSVGNPHCVIFVDDLANYPVQTIGRLLETHSLFPQRINVEFIQLIEKKKFAMRVWERGTGETMACGSGACAAAVAGVLNNYTERKVIVKLRGGILDIHWNIEDDHVYMTGPADSVFEGTADIQ